MNVTEAILTRRSVRKYQPNVEIPQEHINQMLTAAMHAPSACNCRPWEFVVVRDPAVRKRITEIHPYSKALNQASLAIVVCGLPQAQQGIAEGFWPQDCAAATENILLAAKELGYGTCWCAIHPHDDRSQAFAELLGVESTPFSLIIVGKPEEQPAARGFFDPARVKYI